MTCRNIDEIKGDVAKATVHITRRDGQGVLVPGNLVLTAAHCIAWSCEGGMALGDHFVEEIECGGRSLRVGSLAVEPVSDIAALGSLDNQTFWKEAQDFEDFCEGRRAVPLCNSNFEIFQPFPVWILTPKGAWVGGQAQQTTPEAHTFWVEAEEQIEGGTSGGPVINEEGMLVGVVSNFNEAFDERKCNGPVPRPYLALPHWIVRRIGRNAGNSGGSVS